jgi:hypothetical protein
MGSPEEWIRKSRFESSLERMADAFETATMPQIHVSVGALAASNPAHESERPEIRWGR